MALKQPNSGAGWRETQGSGAAPVIAPVALSLNTRGGLTPTPSGSVDARLFANAHSGVTVTDGPGNPSGLAETCLIDLGPQIITYD